MPTSRRAFAILVPCGLALAACTPDAPTAAVPGEPGRALAAFPSPACVQFNVPPLGAVFGAPAGQPPGTVVFVENGVRVSVQRYHVPGGTLYDRVRIINTPVPGFGAGKVADLSVIGVGFDFSMLGWTPKTVRFEWADNGGVDNLKVNGSIVWQGEVDTPPSPFGGVNITSAFIPGPPQQGTTTLTGGLTSYLQVGGGQFLIDNVCAYM